MSVSPSPVASKQSTWPADPAWKTTGCPNGASFGFVTRIAERAAASPHLGAAETDGGAAAAASTTIAPNAAREITRSSLASCLIYLGDITCSYMASTSVTSVILGLLALGPRSGYEIKATVDRSTRFFWAASYGQIYPELRRLERDGLIEGEDAPNGARPRRVYRLTDAGR